MKKNDIKIFGEASNGHVEKRGLFSYISLRKSSITILTITLLADDDWLAFWLDK